MTESELDRLLTAPLAEIGDRGFSANVTESVARLQREREYWIMAALFAAGAILLAQLPLVSLGNTLEKVTWELGSSAPLAIAIGMLVLSNSLARLLAD